MSPPTRHVTGSKCIKLVIADTFPWRREYCLKNQPPLKDTACFDGRCFVHLRSTELRNMEAPKTGRKIRAKRHNNSSKKPSMMDLFLWTTPRRGDTESRYSGTVRNGQNNGLPGSEFRYQIHGQLSSSLKRFCPFARPKGLVFFCFVPFTGHWTTARSKQGLSVTIKMENEK